MSKKTQDAQVDKPETPETPAGPLGTQDNPLIVKQLYNDCFPSPPAECDSLEEMQGLEGAREQARIEAQNTIFAAERMAHALLMNPNVRVVLRGEPMDASVRIEGKTQGQYLARQAFNFTRDYEYEMRNILQEEMARAEEEYVTAEAANFAGQADGKKEDETPNETGPAPADNAA